MARSLVQFRCQALPETDFYLYRGVCQGNFSVSSRRSGRRGYCAWMYPGRKLSGVRERLIRLVVDLFLTFL